MRGVVISSSLFTQCDPLFEQLRRQGIRADHIRQVLSIPSQGGRRLQLPLRCYKSREADSPPPRKE